MGATPKRKRLEKTEPMPPVSSQKFYCCRCGLAYNSPRYFQASHSPMYRGSGRLPMCLTCQDKMYNDYRATLGSDREALRRMCMKLDLYWSDSIYEMIERDNGVQNRLRAYISRTNLAKYLSKSYDDTILEEASSAPKETACCEPAPVVSQREPLEVTQDMVDFWGPGYTPEFYDDLERRYREWTNGAEVADPSERSLYKQICLLETIIARDAAAGKQIDKNVSALNSLLGSMNLKPAQRKESADSELEQMPLGVGIQKWEYSRPLPETPDNLKDVRGTIKNITTWYLGHVCKMVGLRNSYCRMYEDAMEELRVKHPEYEEEDDDTLLSDLFGSSQQAGDTA